MGVPSFEFSQLIVVGLKRLQPGIQWIRPAVEHCLLYGVLLSDGGGAILEHLTTTDQKDEALKCLHSRHKNPPSIKGVDRLDRFFADYNTRNRRHIIADLGFFILESLGQNEEAIQWFNQHINEFQGEMAVCFLLDLLDETEKYSLWIREYDKARNDGSIEQLSDVHLRYNEIQELLK